MSRHEKKVVLLVVEGNSEEVLLFKRLESAFSQHNIRFDVQRGDILYDADRDSKSIKSVIGDAVKTFISKNKFTTKDILAVLHIIDTDGCFISDDEICINEGQEVLTFYKQNEISVASEKQKAKIALRNKERSKNINTMWPLTTIISGKVDYRMYYFSRNLEHVLFDEPNPKKESKFTDVENFIDALEITLEDYLEKYLPPISEADLSENYKETWDHISKDIASLHRFTNIPLLFDFIISNTES